MKPCAMLADSLWGATLASPEIGGTLAPETPVVEIAFRCIDAHRLEVLVHRRLEHARVNVSGFSIDLDTAVEAIQRTAAAHGLGLDDRACPGHAPRLTTTGDRLLSWAKTWANPGATTPTDCSSPELVARGFILWRATSLLDVVRTFNP